MSRPSPLLRYAAVMAQRLKPRRPLVVVVGATATGKSQLAVDIAARFNGEVINGDAMQLYEGLPVITNKIRPDEMKGVPHHLLGVVPLTGEPWTVGNFLKSAQERIASIHSAGRLPVLVGGTHYYLQSLLFQSTVTGPVNDEPAAERAEDNTSSWPILDAPTGDILDELRRVDPVMANRWHPNDRRKIRRSLEIYLDTGRRASDVYADQQNRSDESSSHGKLAYPTIIFWTHTDREALVERLDTRVETMLAQGLLAEVRLLQRTKCSMQTEGGYVDSTRGIWVSIGYKEFVAYADALSAGDASSSELALLQREATEQTKAATRQYAKSQIKWIRIKLLNALREANAGDALYLVDTKDPNVWQDHILGPVKRITDGFLNGKSLPRPIDLSETARTLLTPKQDYDFGQRPDLWGTRTCDLCSVTATTEKLWQQHIRGRSHRSALKAQKKLQQHP